MSFEASINSENNLEKYKQLKRNATNLLSQLNTWQNEYAALRAEVDGTKQAELDTKRNQFMAQIKSTFGI